MNTQELLRSSNMIGLTLPRTSVERVAAMEILSLPKAILPQVKSQSSPAARTEQVARSEHRPFCYQPEIGEEIVFAVLASAALFLILMVFL